MDIHCMDSIETNRNSVNLQVPLINDNNRKTPEQNPDAIQMIEKYLAHLDVKWVDARLRMMISRLRMMNVMINHTRIMQLLNINCPRG